MSARVIEEPVEVRSVMEVSCDHSPCRAAARCLATRELAPTASDLPAGWVQVRVSAPAPVILNVVFCPRHAFAAALVVGTAQELPERPT